LKQTGSYREAVGKLPGNYREGMSEQTSVALDAKRHDPTSQMEATGKLSTYTYKEA
jgi:hypothetical protein